MLHLTSPDLIASNETSIASRELLTSAFKIRLYDFLSESAGSLIKENRGVRVTFLFSSAVFSASVFESADTNDAPVSGTWLHPVSMTGWDGPAFSIGFPVQSSIIFSFPTTLPATIQPPR